MRLIVVHQILIASAIALAALFAIRAAVLFARGGGPANLGLTLAASAVGAALLLYLQSFRRKSEQQERSAPRR
jgi:hypothetical protein